MLTIGKYSLQVQEPDRNASSNSGSSPPYSELSSGQQNLSSNAGNPSETTTPRMTTMTATTTATTSTTVTTTATTTGGMTFAQRLYASGLPTRYVSPSQTSTNHTSDSHRPESIQRNENSVRQSRMSISSIGSEDSQGSASVNGNISSFTADGQSFYRSGITSPVNAGSQRLDQKPLVGRLGHLGRSTSASASVPEHIITEGAHPSHGAHLPHRAHTFQAGTDSTSPWSNTPRPPLNSSFPEKSVRSSVLQPYQFSAPANELKEVVMTLRPPPPPKSAMSTLMPVPRPGMPSPLLAKIEPTNSPPIPPVHTQTFSTPQQTHNQFANGAQNQILQSMPTSPGVSSVHAGSPTLSTHSHASSTGTTNVVTQVPHTGSQPTLSGQPVQFQSHPNATTPSRPPQSSTGSFWGSPANHTTPTHAQPSPQLYSPTHPASPPTQSTSPHFAGHPSQPGRPTSYVPPRPSTAPQSPPLQTNGVSPTPASQVPQHHPSPSLSSIQSQNTQPYHQTQTFGNPNTQTPTFLPQTTQTPSVVPNPSSTANSVNNASVIAGQLGQLAKNWVKNYAKKALIGSVMALAPNILSGVASSVLPTDQIQAVAESLGNLNLVASGINLQQLQAAFQVTPGVDYQAIINQIQQLQQVAGSNITSSLGLGTGYGTGAGPSQNQQNQQMAGSGSGVDYNAIIHALVKLSQAAQNTQTQGQQTSGSLHGHGQAQNTQYQQQHHGPVTGASGFTNAQGQMHLLQAPGHHMGSPVHSPGATQQYFHPSAQTQTTPTHTVPTVQSQHPHPHPYTQTPTHTPPTVQNQQPHPNVHTQTHAQVNPQMQMQSHHPHSIPPQQPSHPQTHHQPQLHPQHPSQQQQTPIHLQQQTNVPPRPSIPDTSPQQQPYRPPNVNPHHQQPVRPPQHQQQQQMQTHPQSQDAYSQQEQTQTYSQSQSQDAYPQSQSQDAFSQQQDQTYTQGQDPYPSQDFGYQDQNILPNYSDTPAPDFGYPSEQGTTGTESGQGLSSVIQGFANMMNNFGNNSSGGNGNETGYVDSNNYGNSTGYEYADPNSDEVLPAFSDVDPNMAGFGVSETEVTYVDGSGGFQFLSETIVAASGTDVFTETVMSFGNGDYTTVTELSYVEQ